jgi:hypothetical protein
MIRALFEGRQGKEFFCEQKNQKTFIGLSRLFSENSTQAFESLLLLFFRKEGLASLSHDYCILASGGHEARFRFMIPWVASSQ